MNRLPRSRTGNFLNLAYCALDAQRIAALESELTQARAEREQTIAEVECLWVAIRPQLRHATIKAIESELGRNERIRRSANMPPFIGLAQPRPEFLPVSPFADAEKRRNRRAVVLPELFATLRTQYNDLLADSHA